jgi:DDE_Tnp_1-associated
MSEIAILEAFEGMPDGRRGQGKRHSLQLSLALFTLAIAAGNQGFEAIGDWLKSYCEELTQLFEVKNLPSYSTIRRVLLQVDYIDYAARLSRFFGVYPQAGETVSLDGKTLKGSYVVQANNPTSEPHPAVILVTAYVVEKGLILPPRQVEFGSNEITALPQLIKDLALKGVVFAFDSMNTQKKLLRPL